MNDQDYIINVGPQGTFRPSGNYQTIPAHIDAMFQRFEHEKPKRIALYFHGGLVGERIGMETARKMGAHITAAGCAPVCFAWETGLIETVRTNLMHINSTALFQKLLRLLLKKLEGKIGFTGAPGRGPGKEMTDAQIEAELMKPHPFEGYTNDLAHTPSPARGNRSSIDMLPSDAALTADLQQEFEEEINKREAEFIAAAAESPVDLGTTAPGGGATPVKVSGRGVISTVKLIAALVKVAYRVIKRFVNKTDHSFYPSVIEELLREIYVADLGAWVWSAMKVKSEQMWRKDPEDNTDFGQRAGRYFLDRLMAFLNSNPSTTVDLIGHSAGSIAICNLFRHAATDFPTLRFRNIIFMAPACRVELFHEQILSQTDRFDNFRMYTMFDEVEKQDSLVPFLYTHSLLYLISGILEDKGESFDAWVLGLERHIARLSPYDQLPDATNEKIMKEVNAYLYEKDKRRIVFSRTPAGGDGFNSTSASHGGFDDDEPTTTSIKFLLALN